MVTQLEAVRIAQEAIEVLLDMACEEGDAYKLYESAQGPLEKLEKRLLREKRKRG